jgi:RNA polymerase sigma-70 factor, ECF subfamily
MSPPPPAGAEPSDHPSDEALLAAHLAGDVSAFDELVRRYRRRVYGICYRYFRSPGDAEDAAQEAFVALLRRAETFAGQSRFSTWMYRVTVNACNDLARKRARRPQAADVEVADLPGDDEAAQAALESRELAVELREALGLLDPEHRRAVVLHDVYGLGYAEIADDSGVAVGTVKSRIHRAHSRLAESLAHLREEPSRPLEPPTVQP